MYSQAFTSTDLKLSSSVLACQAAENVFLFGQCGLKPGMTIRKRPSVASYNLQPGMSGKRLLAFSKFTSSVMCSLCSTCAALAACAAGAGVSAVGVGGAAAIGGVSVAAVGACGCKPFFFPEVLEVLLVCLCALSPLHLVCQEVLIVL